eukprot:6153307-Amphidinium_carterae.1
MSGLVTILCHAECLGAWTFFWAPCTGSWQFAPAKFEAALKTSRQDSVIRKDYRIDNIHCHLVSRSEICTWRWHNNGRDCMEAVIEHIMYLLSPKFAHYTFTTTAWRIVKMRLGGKGMALGETHVLLKVLWLVTTLCGPCLPILNALIAMLANIYPVLLFGTNTRLLDMHKTEEHVTSMPSLGFGTFAFLAMVLQLSNLL